LERSSVEEDDEISKDTFGNPRKYNVSHDSEMESDLKNDWVDFKIEYERQPSRHRKRVLLSRKI